jgi:uncharacterized protein (TIGR02246 family)
LKRLLFVLLFVACATTRRTPPEATIEAFLAALDKGDPNIASLFTTDATVFMPMLDQPVRIEGRDNIAATFGILFGPNYRGGMPQREEQRVEMMGDVALVTFQTTNPNVTSRRTFVLRHEEGRWLIAHLHGSNIRKECAKRG